MAKQAKIKAVVSYVGKGKNKPVLPVGQDGDLTISQGESKFEIRVRTAHIAKPTDPQVALFNLKDLCGCFGIKPAVAKHLTLIDLLPEGEKKPQAYVTLGHAVLLAATARTLNGSSPVTQWFLGTAMTGFDQHFGPIVPQLFALPVAE